MWAIVQWQVLQLIGCHRNIFPGVCNTWERKADTYINVEILPDNSYYKSINII